MTSPKLLLAIALALLVAASAAAQAPESVEVATGAVVSTSSDSLIVDTETGQQVFVLDPAALLPQPAMAGSVVTVKYRTDDLGNKVATEITVERTAEEMEALPQTASPLPLVALGGLLALAGALALRLARF